MRHSNLTCYQRHDESLASLAPCWRLGVGHLLGVHDIPVGAPAPAEPCVFYGAALQWIWDAHMISRLETVHMGGCRQHGCVLFF